MHGTVHERWREVTSGGVQPMFRQYNGKLRQMLKLIEAKLKAGEALAAAVSAARLEVCIYPS